MVPRCLSGYGVTSSRRRPGNRDLGYWTEPKINGPNSLVPWKNSRKKKNKKRSIHLSTKHNYLVRFFVLLNNRKWGLMTKGWQAPGCKSCKPAIQIARFTQKGQGHWSIVSQLTYFKTMLFVTQTFHRCISQINHPQRSTNLLLRIEHRKVFQRGAIDNHVHPLLPSICRDQSNTATLRFCCHWLLGSQEVLLMINGHFGRHLYKIFFTLF